MLKKKPTKRIGLSKYFMLGLVFLGLSAVLTPAIATVQAEPAEAIEGLRVCYHTNDGYIQYFVRERDHTRCDLADGLYDDAINVPYLYRDGSYYDMSICENFTDYLATEDALAQGKFLKDGDICWQFYWDCLSNSCTTTHFSHDYPMETLIERQGYYQYAEPWI